MKSLSSSFILTHYKAIEFEVTDAGNLFEFSIMINSKCDHAGLRFVISLFGYDVSVNVYDIRHWDYENNCYYQIEKEIL